MKRWYVVQVYAGYEEAVKADLLKRVEELELQNLVGQVMVPSAKMKGYFTSPDEQDQQLFPGYVLVEAEMGTEVFRLVNSTPRVMRFLGGKDPIPLSKKEIERVVSQVKGEVIVGSEKSEFVVGREIEIKEGPFAGFVGVIDKVDEADERLTVMVSIFGRMTPVELGFDQVQR